MNLREASQRTAITRSTLSAPMAWYLDRRPDFYPGKSILHLGCGKAIHDSNALREEAGFYAEYDPGTAPDTSVLRVAYDYVFAVYVLNTLPESDRIDCYHQILRCLKVRTKESISYPFRRPLAIVAVRRDLGNTQGTPHDDGIITSRGTFQTAYGLEKMYTEIRDMGGRPYWTHARPGYIIAAFEHKASK